MLIFLQMQHAYHACRRTFFLIGSENGMLLTCLGFTSPTHETVQANHEEIALVDYLPNIILWAAILTSLALYPASSHALA